MTNEIDDLMDLDPLLLSDQNIDTIIAYQRKQRAMVESGVKPKRPTGPKVTLDLAKLGLAKVLDAPTVKRRV